MRARSVPLPLGLVGLVGLAVACGGDELPQKYELKGIRLIAVRAEPPYVAPGETVKLEALVVDHRPPGPEATRLPMKLHWFPSLCVNPPDGQYYGCYSSLEAPYPLRTDLDPLLPEGKDATFTVAPDALNAFQPTPGGPSEPVVTAFAFFIACAGHVERVERKVNLAINNPPFACFGPNGERKGVDETFFGFSRVSVFATRKNAHPAIVDITFKGGRVDRAAGFRVKRCDLGWFEDDFLFQDCPDNELAVVFDDASSEVDPDAIDAAGRVGRETLYVDWFTSIGKLNASRRIVFDPFDGRPEVQHVELDPGDHPGKGVVWAVLHDSRGGVSWLSVPIEIE